MLDRGSHNLGQVIEEPDEVKVSCPVLKTNGSGDRFVEFNYFRPLPRQSKTADLKLNRDKVLRRCYEVPSLYKQHTAEITNNSIQLSLF
jgi:hypothetical protein